MTELVRAFIGLTRVLAIVEGRLVEAMTGERMPRRVQPATTGGWLERIGAMLRDLRTWTTLAYQLLALPLGVVYFPVAVTLLAFGVAMFGGGIVEVLRTLGLDVLPGVQIGIHVRSLSAPLMALVGIGSALFGALVLTLLMHLARWVGHAQGKFAKKMLVTA